VKRLCAHTICEDVHAIFFNISKYVKYYILKKRAYTLEAKTLFLVKKSLYKLRKDKNETKEAKNVNDVIFGYPKFQILRCLLGYWIASIQICAGC
jgi:hypothetical protein